MRLHVLKTPWFAICIHWIKKPDPEPFEHDHPVSFLSVILRGRYTEKRNNVYKRNKWFNFFRATDNHTIMDCDPDTMTICFMGPKVRDWGFHTDEGWIYWRDYYKNLEKYRTP